MRPLLLLILITALNLQAQVDKIKIEKRDTIANFITDQDCEFTGGWVAMRNFISANYIYPQSAREAGISGTCYLKIMVNKVGMIENVEVIKGITGCPECDSEAVRLFRIMPKWKPAIKEGKPVNTYFNFPFQFKIQ